MCFHSCSDNIFSSVMGGPNELVRLEVPGVLTCHHREKGLLEGGLDPQIAAYITDAGLDGLLQVPNIDLDHALITVLVERCTNWGNLCAELLGHRPPDKVVGASENTAMLCGPRPELVHRVVKNMLKINTGATAENVDILLYYVLLHN
ncbi:hypothetical protein SO802_018417 [Lithocarpus litseifolius]|uniref:Uncharacterized protein n=1 Tax=Lithocarpus litseifolius TaxID=425828 RepID=A0AAW2CKX1_9ROSI